MVENESKLSKRDAILRSAYMIFTQKGYHSTKVSEIAQLANVGKGTVYGYFSSKEEILREVIKQGIKYYIQQINNSIKELDNPTEKIKILIQTHADIINEHKKVPHLFENFGIMTKEFRDFLFSQKQILIANIEQIIDEGIQLGEFRAIDKKVAATIIMGSIASINFESDSLQPTDIGLIIDILQNGLLV